MKVFISYAREDFDDADRLYKYLKAKEIDVWMDYYCLIGGQDWSKVIEKQIKESKIFIAILSKVSLRKTGVVQKEFKLAEMHQEEKPSDHIYIVPVVLGDCEVPAEFSKYHYISLDKSDGYEKVYQSIGSSIKVEKVYANTETTIGFLDYPFVHDDILPPAENFYQKDFVYLSTLPGIFYRAASPNHEPYFREGEKFGKGDVLFMIECNKLFIEFKAKEEGIIGSFLAKDKEQIEKGSPIFLFYYAANRKEKNEENTLWLPHRS